MAAARVSASYVNVTAILTINEVADYLRISSSKVYRMVWAGQIPAFKIGFDWRFSLDAIERWRLGLEGRDDVYRD